MFSARQFLIDTFQTPDRLVAFVSAYGLSAPKAAAVAKWFYRGNVPGEWLPVLLALLELEHGAVPSLSPYLDMRRAA